jgi:hypothetical protein
MGAVLNRSTMQYIEFVNTPDYDPTTWVINPDLSPVTGIDSKFWVINSDDTIREMTSDEEDTAYLASAITSQCNLVSSYRDSILYADFNYNSVPFDSDPQSITNITGTQTFISAGGTLPDNFMWRAADNTNQAFNNTTFTYFYMASVAWVEAIWGVSWYHKANISALTHYTDVMAYDYTTNWPTGFSGSGVTY